MAQKAAKAIAKRNGQILNQTHLIALIINGLFLVFRGLLFRASFSGKSILLYVLLSAPAMVVETMFEVNSRPKYADANRNDLKRSGEDLEAKGLTEWMWDLLYWTWACIGLAAIFGDTVWWLYLAVPIYSAWLAYTTFTGVRGSLGLSQGAQDSNEQAGATGSKRSAKMEKRGGQRVQYR